MAGPSSRASYGAGNAINKQAQVSVGDANESKEH